VEAGYQSSAQGRFTSVDPLGASASVGDPQSFNRYSYVNNNPTNLTDPSGMQAYDASNSYTDAAGSLEPEPFNPNRSHFGGFAILYAAGLFHDIGVMKASQGSSGQTQGSSGQTLHEALLTGSGSSSGSTAHIALTDSLNMAGWIAAGQRLGRHPHPVSAVGGPNHTVIITWSDGSQEVRTGGTRTWRNNNPGNIGAGRFARGQGAIGSAGGFAVFPTEEAGRAAVPALLNTPAYQAMSLDGAIASWAPPNENDTPAYQRQVQGMTGLAGNTNMNTLTADQIGSVAHAITTVEGWRVGMVTWRP
jgi:hypothetical protein